VHGQSVVDGFSGLDVLFVREHIENSEQFFGEVLINCCYLAGRALFLNFVFSLPEVLEADGNFDEDAVAAEERSGQLEFDLLLVGTALAIVLPGPDAAEQDGEKLDEFVGYFEGD